MIERAQAALAAAREDTVWSGLAYAKGTDPDGHDTDRNAGRRALVLWGMQYDWRADDLPLHRFLAEQEALCRGNAPFSGTSDEYEIAGYLLARHRLVADVWRQWDLKTANFDTSIAYDVEALVVAGVEDTLRYVRASAHPYREAVLARLAEGVTDEDVTRYFARKARWFPSDPDSEDPKTWEQRAEDLAYWGS
ncbi:hypothetical protein [Actinophytocola sp.]|uniref:hypothetical protein n=1 Tax=Actinophytocola sp. TaxID=1872138 RepID=UPI002ED39362